MSKGHRVKSLARQPTAAFVKMFNFNISHLANSLQHNKKINAVIIFDFNYIVTSDSKMIMI